MAVDIATLALRVDALEVANADKKLDNLARTGKTAENSAKSMTGAFKALAGVLATIKVADMVRDAAMMAARYETMGVVMQVVGNNAGYTGDQMESAAKKLQDFGIAMLESREVTTRLVQAQIDLSKATDLARAAQDSAVVSNLNSSETFERMVQGISSAEVEVLRGIGLQVNFEQAYKRFATEVGKSKDALSEYEKMQARVNEVLSVASRNAGAYEASMGTAGKMIKSIDRLTKDLKVSLGEAFGPTVTLLADQLYGSLKDINKGIKEGESIIQAWGKKFLSVVISVEAEVIRLSMLIDKVGGSMTALVSSMADNHNVFGKLASDIDPKFQKFLDPGDIGDNSLKKWADKWNKVYEDRYNAGDKALQKLADREQELLNGTNNQKRPDRLTVGTTGATPVVDDKAAKAAAKAASQYADEVERTLDRLLPLRAATQDYSESLGYLNSALTTGIITKDQYGTALESLNREFEDAKKQSNSYAQAMKDAERATQESALAINGTKIEIAIAQGQLTELEALPFQIDLLQQRLDIQKEYLTEMQKSTPEEITAWNSQAEAIAQTTLQLTEYQQTLRMQTPFEGMKQGFRDIAEEAKITGQDIHDYMVSAVDQLNEALVDFMVDGSSFNSVLDSLSRDMLSMTTKSLITGPLVGGIGNILGVSGSSSIGSGGNVSISSPAMVSINGGASGIVESLFPNVGEKSEAWFGSFFNTGNTQGTSWWDDFYNMGDQVISELAKGASEGIGSGLSSFFGGGGSGGSSWLSTAGSAIMSYFGYHEGGKVGPGGETFTRMLPSSLLNGAPRYHTGLMPDEYAAILQRGETVLTEGTSKTLFGALDASTSAIAGANASITSIGQKSSEMLIQKSQEVSRYAFDQTNQVVGFTEKALSSITSMGIESSDQIMGAFSSLTDGLSSVSSGFSSFGGGMFSGLSSGLGSFFGYHNAGVVGYDRPTFARDMPLSMLANAPRYHNGLMPDEFPAILQRGETVFTRNQTSALGSALSGGNDGETKALLKELIGAVKAGGGTKVINALNSDDMLNAASSSTKERMVFNVIQANPSKIKAMLN